MQMKTRDDHFLESRSQFCQLSSPEKNSLSLLSSFQLLQVRLQLKYSGFVDSPLLLLSLPHISIISTSWSSKDWILAFSFHPGWGQGERLGGNHTQPQPTVAPGITGSPSWPGNPENCPHSIGFKMQKHLKPIPSKHCGVGSSVTWTLVQWAWEQKRLISSLA